MRKDKSVSRLMTLDVNVNIVNSIIIPTIRLATAGQRKLASPSLLNILNQFVLPTMNIMYKTIVLVMGLKIDKLLAIQ